MRHRVLTTITVLLACFSPPALAGWQYSVTVKNVRNQGTLARITFAINEPIHNPALCTHDDHFVVDSSNDPKSALSILLAAYMSDKAINIFVVENSCDPNGRPLVTDVMVGTF